MGGASSSPGSSVAKAGGLVLVILASGQFLMTLDSSVMNVSMAYVAADLGTTITGIQTAITLYTLVMATLMLTGGKLGSRWGRRRAFGIGLVIYGLGSFTTAIAPNLPVLLIGWSVLEGVGAALIMPAIVALVANNFPAQRRSAAYGAIAAAGAIAVATGPLIGGAVTTFASWRYVFLGEVVVVVVIAILLRKISDAPGDKSARLDWVGSVLSVIGLGMVVYGVLRSSEWGWFLPRPGGPKLLGLSPTVWLVIVGLLVVYGLLRWEGRLEAQGKDPLVRPSLFANRQLSGGLTMFFAQFSVQAGVFFAVPLFLSVVLELSALQTGVRLVPLSLALLLAALLIPKRWPRANPRRVVRIGLASMLGGILLLVAGMDPGASASVVALPMVLLGIGLGALSSQLGAVTVSAVDDSLAGEVGGLQNTATNLGASVGTALIGSMLIAALSASVIAGVEASTVIPDEVKAQATTQLAGGVPFLSDTQLSTAMTDAGVSEEVAQEVLDVNSQARLDALRLAFALAGLLAVGALFLSGRIPDVPPGAAVQAPDKQPVADG